MLKNYVLIAVRNLLKHKLYTVVNIVGLAIGIACVILIGLFVENELSFDTHHPNSESLYRVIREFHTSDGRKTYDWRVSGAVGPTLTRDYPEVETTVRMMLRTVWIRQNAKVLSRVFCLADANVLGVFNFPMASGDKSALLEPNSVLITKSAARDYFGDENPIGKVLTVEGSYIGGDYRVAGVLRDIPGQSTIHFDVLSASIRTDFQYYWNSWIPRSSWRGISVYARLKTHASREELTSKMPAMVDRYMGSDIASRNTYHFQPMSEIFLRSKTDYGIHESFAGEGPMIYGDIAHVYASSAAGLFILSIACVNFANLSTARSANRAREVGLRKVAGAHRVEVALQFLGESLLLSILGLFVGLGAVDVFLPHFSDFTGRSLSFDLNGKMMAQLLGLSLVVGVVSGGYPALVLSRFRPALVLKGTLATGAKNSAMRKTLVVFQFATSVALIVIVLITSEQTSYIRNKDLGFDKEQVIETPLLWEHRNSSLREERLWDRYNVVKDAFLQHPNIYAASISRFPHGRGAPQAVFNAYEAGKDEMIMRVNEVDEDFITVFNIPISKGRDFSASAAKTYASESFLQQEEPERTVLPGRAEYILNETAVDLLGWTDPIGKRFGRKGRRSGRVIGVIKDFHTRTLHQPIEPTVLYAYNGVPKNIYLKVSPKNIDETVAHIKRVWRRFLPIRPVSFSFLDDNLEKRYEQERQLGRSMTVFAGIAIFVACLGLLGLVSFLTEQRRKEVGIRKLLGASVGNVAALFLKESMGLMLLSCMLAWPIAYWAAEDWLQAFAYRIEITAAPFVIGGVFMACLTMITMAHQVIKAASTNPADTIKYE